MYQQEPYFNLGNALAKVMFSPSWIEFAKRNRIRKSQFYNFDPYSKSTYAINFIHTSSEITVFSLSIDVGLDWIYKAMTLFPVQGHLAF